MKRTALLCLALAACHPKPKVAPAPPPEPAPKLRLPNVARPLRYTIDLTVDPAQETFSGHVDIQIEMARPVTTLWLNGTDLEISQATLDGQPAKVVQSPPDFVGFQFAQPAKGQLLAVDFRGKTASKESEGIFHQQSGDAWYAFTQFEAIYARRAFPSFDEPSYKARFKLTLHVPPGNVAVANTPIEEEKPGAFTFKETQPLPSYLLAFAVGPFEFADGGKIGKKQIPFRVVVPKGKVAEARWALEATPPILFELESYFGSPFPFEKLDLCAIPLTSGFGAMENPGLITFVESLLLVKPERETIGARRSFASVVAHEMAHYWFGDLVTTAWWDDIWLNEAFANWMETKIIAKWKPDWDHGTGYVDMKLQAMGSDSLVSARRVRQPIESDDDIYNAFDGITYDKGASVLAMFEAWVGQDKFRKGVQAYLHDHAWGNATATDFVGAISAQAGTDLMPAFSTFLDQPGVPLINVEVQCPKNEPPKLVMSQERYLPQGSPGDAAGEHWTIPVCIAWSASGKRGRGCGWMSEPKMEVPLGAKKCPDWVLPNDGGVGYYRVLYQNDALDRLLEDGGRKLPLPERVNVVSDAVAMVQAGKIPNPDVLAFLPQLARDPSREIIDQAVSMVAGLRDHLVPDELRPNYARLVQKLFGARARQLGLKPRPKEDEDTRLLRPQLVTLVADEGEDKKLAADAIALAQKWLADKKAVDPDMVDTVLYIAATRGDKALWEKLRAAAKTADSQRERGRLLSAMSEFRDPAIVKEQLPLVFSDEVKPAEAMRFVWGALGWPGTRAIAYDFVKENFDQLAKRLPENSLANLPWTASPFCDEEHAKDIDAFFKPRAAKFPGGPREIEQAQEAITLCATFRKAQAPGVAAFLKKF